MHSAPTINRAEHGTRCDVPRAQQLTLIRRAS